MATFTPPASGYDGILVMGVGIAGITAALEAAELGSEVFLVEKTPYLGGRVAQLARYFPKLCPPTCGIEINLRRLRDNPRVHLFTSAEVASIEGAPGAFDVAVTVAPRYVSDRCTACGACVDVCPVERPNAFNYGMDTTKAIYIGHEMAYPMKYAIDGQACLGEECGRCAGACPYGAIDLAMKPQSVSLQVGAVVVATGWKPYDASAIVNLAFGHYPNIVTNVMLERMAADTGPTGGRLARPSDGRPVNRVAFIQCAGSRDRLHLPYCSGICCLGSLKQATYILDRNPDAEVYIYYIDLRTPGTYEVFADRVMASPQVHAIKGKVADILWDDESGDLSVVADDMVAGRMSRIPVDLVVLATGMEPSLSESPPAMPAVLDDRGFVLDSGEDRGVYAAGCAREPMDVATATMDATAAAMMAVRSIRKSTVR